MRILIKTLFIGMIYSGAVFAQSSSGQQKDPNNLTPEELVIFRKYVAEQDAAKINSPEEIEALREKKLYSDHATEAVGFPNQRDRVLQNREVVMISDGSGIPYPIQSVEIWESSISSISFFDHLGKPWPIDDIVFDTTQLSINSLGCDENSSAGGRSSGENLAGKGNILSVMPCDYWTTSTIQVLLKDEVLPIVLDISSGSEDDVPYIDASVAFKIQSNVERPFGRTRSGEVNNDWIVPQTLAMKIDPIDTIGDTGSVNTVVLARDLSSDISFLDNNKNPWPIQEVYYTSGILAVGGECADKPGGLTKFEPGENASTFYVTLCEATRANISVKLVGRAGAISILALDAIPKQRQPHGTVSVYVTGHSPYKDPNTASDPAIAAKPAIFSPDAALDDFLKGAPLEGSQRANVQGGDASVSGWFYDGALYLRGSFNVVNPAYDASASSSDGAINVWKFDPPVSRLLAKDLSGREFVLNIQN